MPITVDQSWQEVEKILQKPQVLSLSNTNEIMMTLTWENWDQETSSLIDFLNLTDIEQKEVLMMEEIWFFLVWDRIIWLDYPVYFKEFKNNNSKLFSWWKEIYLKRDEFKEDTSGVIFPNREKRELIFVKLELPEVIAPEVQKEIMNLKWFVKKILANVKI